MKFLTKKFRSQNNVGLSTFDNSFVMT